jgi:hypothetical protein
MESSLTVLIPAWNAADWIGRALASIDQSVRVIVVDDHSSDGTAEVAKKACPWPIRVLCPVEKRSLGLVRQTALDAVETPYAVWLDADDAFLPGRIDRLMGPLLSGQADVVSDGQELVDGVSGQWIRDLPIPHFVGREGDQWRLFERNWLPGIAHVAFRTELAKRVGYDVCLHGGDDSDFVWRMTRAGARFSFLPEKGYRMHAYPGSDSRKLDKQRGMVKHALQKHGYDEVSAGWKRAGFSGRVTAWGLCSMAMFRGEWSAALGFLEEACPVDVDPDEVLEPQGPYPLPEGWRYGFTRGTLHLLMDQPHEAVDQLRSAKRWNAGADVWNNLGVALRQCDREAEAREAFQKALVLFPAYLDAKLNLESGQAARITTHPLRLQPSRCEY